MQCMAYCKGRGFLGSPCLEAYTRLEGGGRAKTYTLHVYIYIYLRTYMYIYINRYIYTQMYCTQYMEYVRNSPRNKNSNNNNATDKGGKGWLPFSLAFLLSFFVSFLQEILIWWNGTGRIISDVKKRSFRCSAHLHGSAGRNVIATPLALQCVAADAGYRRDAGASRSNAF